MVMLRFSKNVLESYESPGVLARQRQVPSRSGASRSTTFVELLEGKKLMKTKGKYMV